MAKTYSVLLLTSRDPRRLKTPSSLLPFGDQPVLRRTLDAYMALEPREVIVVSAESQERIHEALGSGPGTVTVVSSPEVRGHTGLGLKLGLERLASEPEVLLVGLGDQPLLHPQLLRDLAALYEQTEGTLGVTMCQDIPGHPVFVPSSFLGELREMEPGKTHRDLILRHPDQISELETDETAVLRTVEDPESYRELLALAGLPEPPPPVREPAPVVEEPEPQEETLETAAPEPAASEAAASEPAASEAATPEPTASEAAAPEPGGSESAAPEPVASEPATTEEEPVSPPEGPTTAEEPAPETEERVPPSEGPRLAEESPPESVSGEMPEEGPAKEAPPEAEDPLA